MELFEKSKTNQEMTIRISGNFPKTCETETKGTLKSSEQKMKPENSHTGS